MNGRRLSTRTERRRGGVGARRTASRDARARAHRGRGGASPNPVTKPTPKTRTSSRSAPRGVNANFFATSEDFLGVPMMSPSRATTTRCVTSLSRTRAVAMPPPGDAPEATCAVCLEAVTPASKASMPCCDRDTASVSLCGPCVRFICARGPGGVGRCPKCRAHVRPASSATAHDRELAREEDAPATSYGDANEGEGEGSDRSRSGTGDEGKRAL